MMNVIKACFYIFLPLLFNTSCGEEIQTSESIDAGDMMTRIAAIEIHANYFDEYVAILKEEAKKSVELEEGVICIFPMYEKNNPTQIRLLEIYANETAYQEHLKTPHFLHYKTTTQPMVKSLELIDMEAIDAEFMSEIFTKMSAKK